MSAIVQYYTKGEFDPSRVARMSLNTQPKPAQREMTHPGMIDASSATTEEAEEIRKTNTALIEPKLKGILKHKGKEPEPEPETPFAAWDASR